MTKAMEEEADIVPNRTPRSGGGPWNAEPSLCSLDLDDEAHDACAKRAEETARLIGRLDAFRKENGIDPPGLIYPPRGAAVEQGGEPQRVSLVPDDRRRR
ncbi:MAG: hypothetical protein K0R64_2177 [Novosphingobium lindaniclasticum]|jgi:hypothetical protein|uniref:hypothetical protein n=1 Tax=Novosphingobium lindaniclasticum TaxID=1329895 RepID=UPI00240A7DD7|nr:hypothetical protein [Novosphingobium lindaniclasticum]MDF2639193.1 hypothetical protein [Novosphingobium lindaniclasticum]